MKKKRSTSRMMRGAVMLSLTSLIAKILSAVYRIPFQNMVGNTGFYVYQQVYPIYGIGMIITLRGLPMFISKLVSETADIRKRQYLLYQVTRILIIFSIVIFFLIQLFSVLIARGMGDISLTPIIQSVSWMFLFVPFLSMSRGFFQGHFDMVPTAISQLVEQIVRVSVILSMAFIATHLHWNVYQMGTWVMSSASISALFASGIMIFYWHKNKIPLTVFQTPSDRLVSNVFILKRVLVEGGTISLLASMMVLLQLVDSFSVIKYLMANGITKANAKILKGIFDRGQPLVQLGLVIATAFASSLLPSLTEMFCHGRRPQFDRLVKAALRISLIISTAATIGMVSLMPQLDQVLFGNKSGSDALSVYVISIIFATLITILNSIFQSMNRYLETVIALIVGICIKFLLNYFLVFRWGISGSSLATVISLLVVTMLLLYRVPEIKLALFNIPLVMKLIVTSSGMFFGVRFTVVLVQNLSLSLFNSGRLVALMVIIVCIPVGVTLFILFSIKTGLLTLRECLMVPYVSYLLKRLHW